MNDQWVGAEIPDISAWASEIDAHVELLKLDALFIRSRKLCQLLEYLLAELSAGRASKIKSYSIALDVFGKDESFDSQKDTIVRVQMGKLRKRLEHYYAKTESDLRIEIPKRSYIPKIYRKSDDQDKNPTATFGAFRPTIRLAPFHAIGNSEDLISSAQSLESELLTVLSKFSRVHVSRAVAEKSNQHASYILSGSIRQSGNKIRVSAELESERSSYMVWSEQYDILIEELSEFDALEKLAVKISIAVADNYGFLSHRIISDGSPAPTLLMKSYSYLRNHNSEMHLSLIDDIRELIESETDNAQVWSLWSLLNLDAYRYRHNENKLNLPIPTAIQAGRQATGLDPQNSFAFRCLALGHFYHKDFRRFKKFGLRSIELNPNSTDNRADYGRHLYFGGDFAEGIAQANIAIEHSVDPPNWYHHASAFEAIRNRDWEEARKFRDGLKGYRTMGDYFLETCISGHLGEKIDDENLLRTTKDFAAPNAVDAFNEGIERWHIPLTIQSIMREGLEKAGILKSL